MSLQASGNASRRRHSPTPLSWAYAGVWTLHGAKATLLVHLASLSLAVSPLTVRVPQHRQARHVISAKTPVLSNGRPSQGLAAAASFRASRDGVAAGASRLGDSFRRGGESRSAGSQQHEGCKGKSAFHD